MMFIRVLLLSVLCFSLGVQGGSNNSQPINCAGNEVPLHDDLTVLNHTLVKEISLEDSVLILLELDFNWRKETIENITKTSGDTASLRRELGLNLELVYTEQAQCLVNHYKAGDRMWEFKEESPSIRQGGIALYRNNKLIAVVFTELVYKD